MEEHYCENTDEFNINKFLQSGQGLGKEILIVGEAPAPNGWRKSGKAFYTQSNKLLPTGKNLNILLSCLDLNVELCNFTELIKCFVGSNRKRLNFCGHKCWPIFKRQLEQIKPTLIITLGVKTLEIFNNETNLKLEIGILSKVEIDNIKYYIFPIYHPSPIAPFNQKRNLEIFNKSKDKIISLITN